MTAVYGLGVCLGTTVGALVESECWGHFTETFSVENKNGNFFFFKILRIAGPPACLEGKVQSALYLDAKRW